jgi:hypothetical protein
MPLQKLSFRPGVNRESTALGNEGGWYDCNNIRFRSGQAEKIGGWTSDSGTTNSTLQPPSNQNFTPQSVGYPSGYSWASNSFWGICRNIWNWLNLVNYNLLGIGTHLKYYVQNGIGGTFYDITPLRGSPPGTAQVVSSNAFTTTASTAGYTGYVTVTCNVPAHGAINNDFVTISNVSTAINGIPAANLNAEFQLTYVDTSSFTIQVYVTSATVTAGTTGSSINFVFQINTGATIFSYATGFGAGPFGGTSTSVTTTLTTGFSAAATITTLTVGSTTNLSTSYPGVVWIDTEAFTYTGGAGGGTTLTGVTRAYTNTPQTAHTATTTVYQYPSTATGWGIAASTGVPVQLRLWSSANYGQNLIINPSGGAIYYWVNAANNTTYNRAQILAYNNTNTQDSVAYWQTDGGVYNSCPNLCNFILVSDSSNFVIAFGCNDPSGVLTTTALDPLFIRWTDQQNITTWYPTATNQAGSYRLGQGSAIVTAVQTRQEIFILTDTAAYVMQYIGPPYIWGFNIVSSNISIISPNAIVSVNNVTYWMGINKFYMYTGTVQTLGCAVRQFIFDNINTQQSAQIYAGTNEAYNEIWWYFPSISGPTGTGTISNPNTLMDSYVVYNYLDQTWYYGKMNRTTTLYAPLRNTVISTGYNGQLYYQETNVDDGSVILAGQSQAYPINAYVQSADFDIGDGNNFGFVWRLVPDVNFTGSNVNDPTISMTLLPRRNPGSNYGTSNNPGVSSIDNYSNIKEYNVQQFTQQVYVRARGRQMALKISSNTLGVAWQSGLNRLDIRPDGRK